MTNNEIKRTMASEDATCEKIHTLANRGGIGVILITLDDLMLRMDNEQAERLTPEDVARLKQEIVEGILNVYSEIVDDVMDNSGI